jgi:hypothetical protein
MSCSKTDPANSKSSQNSPKRNITIVSGIDYSKITQEKGMLKFQSWQHYAQVIDTLLHFCDNYSQKYFTNIEIVFGKDLDAIDEEMLQSQVERDNFYQFDPLYSFCDKLKFNSLFQKLREDEIVSLKNSNTSLDEALDEANPFDLMCVGYIQSALHNIDGNVIIGDEIFNPKKSNEAKSSCLTNKEVYDYVDFFYNLKSAIIFC